MFVLNSLLLTTTIILFLSCFTTQKYTNFSICYQFGTKMLPIAFEKHPFQRICNSLVPSMGICNPFFSIVSFKALGCRFDGKDNGFRWIAQGFCFALQMLMFATSEFGNSEERGLPLMGHEFAINYAAATISAATV